MLIRDGDGITVKIISLILSLAIVPSTARSLRNCGPVLRHGLRAARAFRSTRPLLLFVLATIFSVAMLGFPSNPTNLLNAISDKLSWQD